MPPLPLASRRNMLAALAGGIPAGSAIAAEALVDLPRATGAGAHPLSGFGQNDAAERVGFKQRGAGTVARTLADKLGELVSVLDYGADPTGAADSTAAINAAIQANNHVHVPDGTYRVDGTVIAMSSYHHRKAITMSGGAKLIRLASHSRSNAPVFQLLGSYGHFDGGFGEIESQNNSPSGVVTLGQVNNSTADYNSLFWSFGNCDVRCKDFSTGSAVPDPSDGVGIYIPSAFPVMGSNVANYYGSVYNVRVFNATTAYFLTDGVNACTFVNCGVEFFWFHAWRLAGAYGNSFYGGFINGCYRKGGIGILLGNRLQPRARNAPGHQSNNNNFFGVTMEFYTTENFGVVVSAGADGYDSAHNFVQFNWNSHGQPIADNTASQTNTIIDNTSEFRIADNLTMPPKSRAGYGLLCVGTTAYSSNHAIARAAPAGTPALVVENLSKAPAPAYGLMVYWNTPTIGYNGAVLSTYHVPTKATRFRVLDSGDVQNFNNSYGAISDARFKTVVGRCGSQWEDVKFLARQLTKYTLKGDENQVEQLGLIAQEVEQRCPGLVFETPDMSTVEHEITHTGGPDGIPEIKRSYSQEPTGEVSKGVRYSIAQLKALKALGEAMERIEALEARLAAKDSA